MRLQQPRGSYESVNEIERNRSLEAADRANHKRGQDVEIGEGRLVISSDDGTRYEVEVANGGAVVVQGMDGNVIANSGIGTLDFGSGVNFAEQTITGVGSITATSIVLCQMRIQATDDHPVDDLLIDPIRVAAYKIIDGTGFTLYGAMENANANGLYRVNWSVL